MSDKQYRVARKGVVEQLKLAQRLHCKHMEQKYKVALEKLEKRFLKPDAAKKYYFHLKPFNKSFFGDENICANLEDNANDIYEIIKLLADHTNDHKDMEVIKRNLRKRKLNHHIFD